MSYELFVVDKGKSTTWGSGLSSIGAIIFHFFSPAKANLPKHEAERENGRRRVPESALTVNT